MLTEWCIWCLCKFSWRSFQTCCCRGCWQARKCSDVLAVWQHDGQRCSPKALCTWCWSCKGSHSWINLVMVWWLPALNCRWVCQRVSQWTVFLGYAPNQISAGGNQNKVAGWLHLIGCVGYAGWHIVGLYTGEGSPPLWVGCCILVMWAVPVAFERLMHHSQCLIFQVVWVSGWRFLSDDLWHGGNTCKAWVTDGFDCELLQRLDSHHGCYHEGTVERGYC